MIPYHRDPRQIIPSTAVKIIGLGGAGTNMLERIALDGMEGAELLAINTDIRTLGSCLAQEKIQLGVNLTKGLGTGGDPELGHQAVLEAEEAIRAAVTGRRIVFLCTGLGGGTGSGAAPIVTRIAREEGAFVVVFATMPFAFEGKRRRDQAETALNELAVLSNALVTFDNNRMGELVLAKQGIHDAFLAADHMICESMKAVIRLVRARRSHERTADQPLALSLWIWHRQRQGPGHAGFAQRARQPVARPGIAPQGCPDGARPPLWGRESNTL
ncbi:MAG: hypothetical protein NTV46_18730 [Verrucomicrobia bacterium]|nr:hypothetical protein [Verrucomicrobiota bacterium]